MIWKTIGAYTAPFLAFVTVLLIRVTEAPASARVRYSRARTTPERGDVPGWVLVTLMTAGLVVALWALAGPMLSKIFTDAVTGVTGP